MKKKYLLFGLFFFTTFAFYGQSAKDPELSGGKSFKVNGRNFVYYPNLALKKPESASTQPSPLSTNGTAKARIKSFGSFQDYEVVMKKDAGPSVNTAGAQNQRIYATSSFSVSPSGFVLYNKTEGKFDVTGGLIQIKLAKGYEQTDLSLFFPVKIVSSYTSYRVLKPDNPENFPALLEELRDSGYISSTKLLLTPPKVYPQ